MQDTNTHARRRSFLKAVGVAGVGSVAGCMGGGGGSFEQTIGMVTAETGPLSGLGSEVIEGGEVALEQLNENVDGEYSLRIEDTAGEVETGLNSVRDLIDDNIPGIVGIISSDIALAARDLLEEEEVPQIPQQGGEPEITQDGTDYSFRYYGNNAQQMEGLLRFFDEEGVSTLGIIGADYSYPRAAVEYIRSRASNFDIEIANVSFVPLGTNNFIPELNRFDNDEIDALFYPYPGGNGVTLIQQTEEAGLKEDNIIVGDSAYSTVGFVEALGEDLDGVHNQALSYETEKSQTLNQTVQDEYDRPVMGSFHITGFDTVMMMGMAMDQADSLDPQDVRDSLQELSYDTAAGWSVDFNDSGGNDAFRGVTNLWSISGEEFSNQVAFRSEPIPEDINQ